LTYLAELGQTVNRSEEALDVARAYPEVSVLKNLDRAEELAQECASCGGGDPKTALAPLNKGGTGKTSIKAPNLSGDLGGSRYVQLYIKLVLAIRIHL
jgi:hypothetical protein